METDAISRKLVSELSGIVGQPSDIAELPGDVGKTSSTYWNWVTRILVFRSDRKLLRVYTDQVSNVSRRRRVRKTRAG